MLDVTLEMDVASERAVSRTFQRLARSASGAQRKRMLLLFGEYMRTQTIKNMKAGTDPMGKPLPPVPSWVRVAGLVRGRKSTNNKTPVPLVASGKMRAAVGTVNVTEDEMEFGWEGEELAKARHAKRGGPGMMGVSERRAKKLYSGIRYNRKTGAPYVRIYTGRGWFSKRCVMGPNGISISITARPRNFFYLTAADADMLSSIATQLIDEAKGAV